MSELRDRIDERYRASVANDLDHAAGARSDEVITVMAEGPPMYGIEAFRVRRAGSR